MTKPKFTPGTWSINDSVYDGHGREILLYSKSTQKRIAMLYKEKKSIYVREVEAEANARLLVVAPSLLANLIQCVTILKIIDPDNPAIKQAEKIIEKVLQNKNYGLNAKNDTESTRSVC